ncbi:MAG: hypothetical protein JSU04_15295 [Bdellovibrionales bacterium]|nr:hypothetical protein [Bdellovibrionales bacterium]
MKTLLMTLTLILTSLFANAATGNGPIDTPWADSVTQVYREYYDRAPGVLVPKNFKMTKVLFHGSQLSNPNNKVFTAYFDIGSGDKTYHAAIQFKTDANGKLDSFEDIFEISASMVTDQNGNDRRFPMGMNESQFALLRQEAFEAAKPVFVQANGKANVGTVYVQTFDASETMQPKISIEVSAAAIPKNWEGQSMSQSVYVLVATNNGKVLNVKKGWYY